MFSKLKKFLARITARKLFNDSRRKTAFSSAPVNPVPEKICKHCGKPFTPKTKHRQFFCSDKCRQNFSFKNHGKIFEKECVICGKKFSTKYEHQKCCSPKCSLFHHRNQVNQLQKKCRAEKRKENSANPVEKTRKGNSVNPVELVCPTCGKTFLSTAPIQIYCSLSCRHKFYAQKNRSKKVEHTCIVCGKTFLAKKVEAQFCSKKCYMQHYYEQHRNPEIEVECRYCGKTFITNRTDRAFCSKECGKNWHNKKKRNAKVRHCLRCGKNIYSLDETKKFCSKRCEEAHARKIANPKRVAKTVEQWNREAAQCGMTYGQYRTAVERFGKTFDELKLPPAAPREEENIIEIKL